MPEEKPQTTPERSDLMSRVRRAGTEPELAVRQLLTDVGAHYRTNVDSLPGRPDIANKSRNRAVFVNGCYWHNHRACDRGALPSSNRDFWRDKFRRNRIRDQKKIEDLEAEGFKVLIVWECELAHPRRLRDRLERFWHGSANGNGGGDPGLLLPLHDPEVPTVEEYSLDAKAGELVRTIQRRDGSLSDSRVPALDLVVGGDFAAAYDQAWLRSPAMPRVDESGPEIRIVDLFSGCGGMTLGAVEACRSLGLRPVPVLAMDMDSEAIGIYHRNFESLGCDRVDDQPIEHVLDGELGSDPTPSEAQLREELGRIHVALGGPPCQGHSNLNNHTRRDDPKNALFARMARFAEVVGPDHLVIENVLGVHHDRGGVFDLTRRHLKSLGYSVASTTLYSERLGVAQQRHRVFLVASKTVAPDLELVEREYVASERSFDWACGDLTVQRPGEGRDVVAAPKAVTKRRIDYLFDHDLYDLPDEERPPCHRNGGHTYPSVYGRIHPDRPTQTITSGFMTMGQGRFVHPHCRRTLTPHEAARLQFIPDWFEFGELSRSAFTRLIGNAVPPKMVYAILGHLLR